MAVGERKSLITTRIPFRRDAGIGFARKIVIPGFGGELKGRIGRRGGIRGFAELQKHGEGAVVLAVIGGFEAMLKGEGSGVVGEGAKGDRGEHRSRCGRRAGLLKGHFQLKAGGLNSPHAQQTPAGNGHGLDQGCFCGIARLKLENESRGEVVEAAHGFAFENDGAGNESGKRRVLRGNSFAFRGDGSGGFRGVGAIGFYLTFSCHTTYGKWRRGCGVVDESGKGLRG